MRRFTITTKDLFWLVALSLKRQLSHHRTHETLTTATPPWAAHTGWLQLLYLLVYRMYKGERSRHTGHGAIHSDTLGSAHGQKPSKDMFTFSEQGLHVVIFHLHSGCKEMPKVCMNINTVYKSGVLSYTNWNFGKYPLNLVNWDRWKLNICFIFYLQ